MGELRQRQLPWRCRQGWLAGSVPTAGTGVLSQQGPQRWASASESFLDMCGHPQSPGGCSPTTWCQLCGSPLTQGIRPQRLPRQGFINVGVMRSIRTPSFLQFCRLLFPFAIFYPKHMEFLPGTHTWVCAGALLALFLRTTCMGQRWC